MLAPRRSLVLIFLFFHLRDGVFLRGNITAGERMANVEYKDCKKREGDVYSFNHFQSAQFFQLLSGSFHRQLAVPSSFFNNFCLELKEVVTIKGRSGASWDVGMSVERGALFLSKDWDKFIDDNSLKKDDLIIFKYKGNSVFDVVIFDHITHCEKELVRKCEYKKLSDGGMLMQRCIRETLKVVEESAKDSSRSSSSYELCKTKRSRRHTTNGTQSALLMHNPLARTEVTEEPSDDSSSSSGIDVFRQNGRHMMNGPQSALQTHHPSGMEITDETSDDSSSSAEIYVSRQTRRHREMNRVQTPLPMQTPVPKRRRTQSSRRPRTEANIDQNWPKRRFGGLRPLMYLSRRPAVTEQMKQAALDKARAASQAATAANRRSFSVVMCPSHVYMGFYMSIPAQWLYANLPGMNDEVILRTKGDRGEIYTWNVILHRRVSGGGLSGGWKFVVENNFLEEDDVCLFVLDEQETSHAFVFDVHFFRHQPRCFPQGIKRNQNAPEKTL